jgi:clusterin-associated protein 1
VPFSRYDPDTAIVDDIDTPQERVRFLQDIAQTMLIKGRVKLNIKRLYAADNKAIREILKVANLLYKASLQSEIDAGVRSSLGQSRCMLAQLMVCCKQSCS